jgi:hypothetical protein
MFYQEKSGNPMSWGRIRFNFSLSGSNDTWADEK